MLVLTLVSLVACETRPFSDVDLRAVPGSVRRPEHDYYWNHPEAVNHHSVENRPEVVGFDVRCFVKATFGGKEQNLSVQIAKSVDQR